MQLKTTAGDKIAKYYEIRKLEALITTAKPTQTIIILFCQQMKKARKIEKKACR